MRLPLLVGAHGQHSTLAVAEGRGGSRLVLRGRARGVRNARALHLGAVVHALVRHAVATWDRQLLVVLVARVPRATVAIMVAVAVALLQWHNRGVEVGREAVRHERRLRARRLQPVVLVARNTRLGVVSDARSAADGRTVRARAHVGKALRVTMGEVVAARALPRLEGARGRERQHDQGVHPDPHRKERQGKVVS